jgi:hypothetical protein
VSELRDILAFREETLGRLDEFQNLELFGARTIVDHLVACDSLLLGQEVKAHQNPGSDQGAPDRSVARPAPEVEARLCLAFANVHIVFVASATVQKYVERIRELRQTVHVPFTTQQLAAWTLLVEEAGSAIKDFRDSRFENARLLTRVAALWPALRSAIVEARKNYGDVFDTASLKGKLNKIEIFVIFAFMIFLVILWAVFARSV